VESGTNNAKSAWSRKKRFEQGKRETFKKGLNLVIRTCYFYLKRKNGGKKRQEKRGAVPLVIRKRTLKEREGRLDVTNTFLKLLRGGGADGRLVKGIHQQLEERIVRRENGSGAREMASTQSLERKQNNKRKKTAGLNKIDKRPGIKSPSTMNELGINFEK